MVFAAKKPSTNGGRPPMGTNVNISLTNSKNMKHALLSALPNPNTQRISSIDTIKMP